MNTQTDTKTNCRFSIIMTQTPDADQLPVLSSLLSSCRQCGEAVPDFLVSDPDSYFLFLMLPDGTNPAVLQLSVLDEETAECRCAVLPDFRRRGFFSALLEKAEDLAGERDIFFALPDTCTDGLAVMHALEAECLSAEYEMACQLAPAVSVPKQVSETLSKAILPANVRWEVAPDGSVTFSQIDPDLIPDEEVKDCSGSCLTTRISDTGVCVHHVEIRKSLRKKGLGTALIRGLLAQLPSLGITRVVLQVSGNNAPALSLYKKTGFAITQSLSYYLY